jgi:hypothetical protein
MKKYKLINQYLFLSFCLMLLFSACTKENSVTIVETVENLEVGFRMDIENNEIETDVFAATCQTDTSEFIIIANKPENLIFPLQTQNFEEGDFTYFKFTSDNTAWSYGGQALGESITGFPGLLISFSDANIEITSNDGNLVSGSSSGVLFGFDGQGGFNTFPYSMSFTAEIIQESDFCE